MRIRQAANNVKADVLEVISNNEDVTNADITNVLGISQSYVTMTLRELEEEGYIKRTFVGRKKHLLWNATGKVFINEGNKRAAYGSKKCRERKTIQVEIKPDLAAMWLVESKPRWEKRSIRIQRSTDLGARQSTF